MKATLKFNLPEEQHEYRNALEGAKMRCALYEIFEMLRSKVKHSDLTDEQYKAYSEVKEFMQKIFIEDNIDIYD